VLPKTLEKAVKKLRSVRGVLEVRLLSSNEREKVLELETEYSRVEVKGFGKPYNKGVFECLKRKHVVVLLTNEEFKWPKGPYAVVELSGTIVAEVNERGLKVFKERIRGLKREHRECRIVFLPLNPPLIEPFKDFQNMIFASPSPRTHEYLLKLFKVEERASLGTMLAGFDDYTKSYESSKVSINHYCKLN